MDKLVFQPNVPVQVALKFPDGKPVEGRFGDQIMFSLTNGQVVFLDNDVAAKIYELELRSREPFWICKRWSGKKGEGLCWDVYRLEGNSASMSTGIPPTALESEIAARWHAQEPGASVAAPAPAKAALQQPSNINGNANRPPNGNGNGHSTTAPPYLAAGIPAPVTKVGYDIALGRILRTTIAALKDAGEQWSDSARQDLVSTLMIQAARDGAVSWLPLAKEDR